MWNDHMSHVSMRYVLPSLDPGDSLYGGLLCRNGRVALVQNFHALTREQVVVARFVRSYVLPPHWRRQSRFLHCPSVVLAATSGVFDTDADFDFDFEHGCHVLWVSCLYWDSYRLTAQVICK